MMRYVVINPCNGYVYRGSGFLVVISYGGILATNAPLGTEFYLRIRKADGTIVACLVEQIVWSDGSALTANANANSGRIMQRGLMTYGDNLVSQATNGSDTAVAVECSTLEEAAQLL